jgi:superfamily II DNA or RNA helicase
MNLAIPIEAFDAFRTVRDFPVSELPSDAFLTLVEKVKQLDEREELEPWLRLILSDNAQTPHGPAEIVDILTTLRANEKEGLAAFILKGKSFPTVRPADVSHQIYRLKKIVGLKFAVFAAPGTILDAAKEQFCSTCEEIGCSYTVLRAEDLARLFVAYGFYCPRDAQRIISGRCKCGYSPTKRILNLLQKEALEGLSRAHSRKRKSGLIVLPPGSGKTRVAAEDASNYGAQCVLYIAHTHEILDVAVSEFEAKFGVENVKRLERADSLSELSRINISTIGLLARHVEKLSPTKFDYLVIDEFHHAAATQYRRIIAKLTPEFLLGLTATPFRGDRQNILKLCDTIIVSYALRFGIETGVLCPFHYFGCFDDVNYSKIQHNGIGYSIRDLEKALIVPERDRAIIKKWREKADGKPTVAFCCSIKHADRVTASFREAGIPSVAYTSEMELDDRQSALRKFKNGEIKILCVVDVLNEGADLPFIECLLFLRPTESQRIFFQQLGRGLRRYTGKRQCTVIDFIGNFKNAYRIVEYQDLLPLGAVEQPDRTSYRGSLKSVLNVPSGCQVTFDDRVIELFYDQTLDTSFVSSRNIRRVLALQYERLEERLGHAPSRKELDRNCVIGSNIYVTCFGSWKSFEQVIAAGAV